MGEIVVHACPPSCDHVDDVQLDFYHCDACGCDYFSRGEDEKVATICPACFVRAGHCTGGSVACSKCGVTAMDRDLMELP